jgi:6,7-dimethyl-8-ribityllumazine synthase
MKEPIEGDLNAGGLRFAVIASRFNDDIVSRLLEGALECLRRHGADEKDISVYRVPGAFEVATTAAEVVAYGNVDAVVALGALIRGETPHFKFISAQTTNELSRVSIASRVPIAFGVITCHTMEQAIERSGPKSGNKGWESALAAIQMANLFKRIRSGAASA